MIKLSKEFRFRQEAPYGCCAMVEIANFSNMHMYRECSDQQYLIDSPIGLYQAVFIDDEKSMAFYQELLDKLDLVFQSPSRKRTDKNQSMFVCIFSDPKRSKED